MELLIDAKIMPENKLSKLVNDLNEVIADDRCFNKHNEIREIGQSKIQNLKSKI